MTLRVAVVGVGPRGLSVVERLLARARVLGTPVELHLYEPADDLGVGIHRRDQPDHILLNTVCAQLTIFSDDAMVGPGAPTTPGPDLFHWAAEREVRTELRGSRRPVRFDDFLPRRILGDYLAWAADRLLADVPPNVRVVRHGVPVTGLDHGPTSTTLRAADGTHQVDLAVVTTGHGLTRPGPYPLPDTVAHVGAGEVVALIGTGLTAMDVVASLTVGRGGRYVWAADGTATYEPAGTEPTIVLVNRSGWLPCARPAITADRVVPPPRHMTVARLAGVPDVRRDVLPLIRAELADTAGDGSAGAMIRSVLDPPARWADQDRYTAAVVRQATYDLVEARHGLAGSAYKRALELLRDHREFLRAAVDGPAGARGYFYDELAALVNRCVIGPQQERVAEVLALLAAGVARLGPGPSPALERSELVSTRLDEPARVRVDHVVAATSRWPVDDPATEPVTAGLRRPAAGWYDALPLSRDGYLLSDGAPVPSLAVLGPPAEGASYYNHYVPSPGVPSRALRDIDLMLDRHLPFGPHQRIEVPS